MSVKSSFGSRADKQMLKKKESTTLGWFFPSLSLPPPPSLLLLTFLFQTRVVTLTICLAGASTKVGPVVAALLQSLLPAAAAAALPLWRSNGTRRGRAAHVASLAGSPSLKSKCIPTGSSCCSSRQRGFYLIFFSMRFISTAVPCFGKHLGLGAAQTVSPAVDHFPIGVRV